MAAAAAGRARALRADHAAKVWRQPSGARAPVRTTSKPSATSGAVQAASWARTPPSASNSARQVAQARTCASRSSRDGTAPGSKSS